MPAVFSDYCEEACHLAACCIKTITGQPISLPVSLDYRFIIIGFNLFKPMFFVVWVPPAYSQAYVSSKLFYV